MAVAHVSGRAGAAAASVGGNVATVGSRGAAAREKEPEQAAKTDDTGRALARRESGRAAAWLGRQSRRDCI